MLVRITVTVDLSQKGARHVAALAAHGDGHSTREKANAVLCRAVKKALERLAPDWPEADFNATLAVQTARVLAEDEAAADAARAAAATATQTNGGRDVA